MADAWATIDAFAGANVPGEPFRCVCGPVFGNPADPTVMAKHAPHVQAAPRR